MTRPLYLKRFFILLAVLSTLGFSQAADTVATVNGAPISTAAFQQRVRFTRWTIGQQLLQILQQSGEKALTDPSSPYNAQYKLLTDSHALGQQVLDALITVQLVSQEAANRGITVTPDEVQQQVAMFFGYTLPSIAPDPAATPSQDELNYEANRDNYFGEAGVTAKMTQDDVLATFAEQALQIKVFQAITSDVPTQVEQVRVRHILVKDEATAKALMPQIKDEASFIEVARANSIDPLTAVSGGDLGWQPRGTYVTEVETAIWNAIPGQLLGPIQTPSGYVLILVLGREVHNLSDSNLARVRNTRYQAWVTDARKSAAVQIVNNWQDTVPSDPTLKDLQLPE